MHKPTTVTVSQQNEIMLTRQLCEMLRVRAGDRLLVNVQDGILILLPQPESYTTAMAGLHSDIWQGVDAQAYVRAERDSSSSKPDSSSASE